MAAPTLKRGLEGGQSPEAKTYFKFRRGMTGLRGSGDVYGAHFHVARHRTLAPTPILEFYNNDLQGHGFPRHTTQVVRPIRPVRPVALARPAGRAAPADPAGPTTVRGVGSGTTNMLPDLLSYVRVSAARVKLRDVEL